MAAAKTWLRPVESPRYRRPRRGRAQRIIVAAGLALLASIFLPLTTSCDSEVLTGESLLRDSLESAVSDWERPFETWNGRGLVGVCGWGSAFVFGAGAAIAAVGRYRGNRGWLMFGAWSLFACGASRAATILVEFWNAPTWRTVAVGSPWTLDNELYWPLIYLPLAVWLVTRPTRTTVGASLLITLVGVGEFAPYLYSMHGSLLYGAYIFIGMQVVLLVALLAELVASVRHARSLPRALLCGIIESTPATLAQACDRCEYPRAGLESSHCPECGEEWSEEDARSTGQREAPLPGGKH